MKLNHLIISLASASLFACGSPQTGTFGTSITSDSALSLELALADFDSIPMRPCKVEGEITEVCQAEGCWFRVKDGSGRELLVRTSDHSFAVPRDIAGKRAIAAGVLKHDTTDVPTLKEFARQDGKSEAEIAAIQAPEIAVVLEAEGVIIR
ncbi:MAG: DUF4920 domain-containing protein [Bacteroidota bacterium]